MPKIKTVQQIVQHYRHNAKSDLFGFEADVLLPYLPVADVKEFVKQDADLSDWHATPLTEEAILAEMRKYMDFAWIPVKNHRGISASRSVEKMQVWLWLLGDEELLGFADNGDNYTNYGAPVLMKICQKYDFAIPGDDGVHNMAQGKPCYEGCEEGCG